MSTPSHPVTTDRTLDTLRRWSDAGLLRHLDSALATFIARLDPRAPPALAVAVALLAHVEGHGHSCLPIDRLTDVPDWLGWPAECRPALAELWQTLPTNLKGWIAALTDSPVVQWLERDPCAGQPLIIDGPAQAPRLYLRRYWQYERTVADAVEARSAVRDTVDEDLTRSLLARLFPVSSDGIATDRTPDWQKIACAIALRGRLTIITGGPGTGKTYTAARLLALLFATCPDPGGLRVGLAAPTGKAAARLKQSIDSLMRNLQTTFGQEMNLGVLMERISPARTLHALLGARPDSRRFRYQTGNPLDLDVLIVDEASMVHLEMMAALLGALPLSARLILLGDKDQLASVEAGAVLGDLCREAGAGHYSEHTARYVSATSGEQIPPRFITAAATPPILAQQTVMLRQSRRFDGPIGQLAQLVNQADDPTLAARLLHHDASQALYAAEAGELETILQLAINGRPGAAGSYRQYLEILASGPEADTADAHATWIHAILQAFDRFRILCSVREGEWGVSGLNRSIAQSLQHAGLLTPAGSWYPGRPVMITRNDPALGVFNGDIGIALPSRVKAGGLRVFFGDGAKLRSVAVSRLAHVETAFAMTVHKSQGSEFEHTVLVLAAYSGNVLTRELLYTAITRARQAFSLITERSGLLEEGVQRVTRRESGLMR